MPGAADIVLVVGTGSAGIRHLRTLAALGSIRPIAVPVRAGRVEDLRAQGFDADESLSAALGRKPLGVVVATDTGRHLSDAEACLQVCPVLVEKPLAGNAADASRIAARASTTRNAVHVACCLRFDPGLRWLKQKQAEAGAITHADAECLSWLPSWRPERDHRNTYAARVGEGGVLLDLVHEIDYLSWFLGAPTHVQGVVENRGLVDLPRGVEESARLSLRHASGVESTLRLSYAVRPVSRRLRIWGDRAMLEWDGVARVARVVSSEGRVLEERRWEGPDEMYRAQAETWVASLRGAPSLELVSVEEAVRAVAVCDATRRSSSRSRWEEVA